ncbi:ABC transporter permease [Kibdelosporangium phytohabitans]|uniref:Transport permease protein n=1 Tax=Kibdelosporangium phytohabitans TaxID=860235 RepID=A0A0N9HNT9_9PSEU|nr:ABC transporter permease [Kibdelosporangium phytohabitans]ALG06067.1 ABC transporter [Kibdelosporangium phytohabitans]MBE1465851.1 ABC-2 type transport system permease protein [Kibdelosporangium phytohabitans]
MTTLALPSPLAIGLARGLTELKLFFRNKEQAIFTFAFPAGILAVIGSVFSQPYGDTGVESNQVLAASMVGAGIIATSFVNLSVSVALDREDGTLSRLRGTPMPAVSYFIGKIILVLVASIAETVLILAVGVGMYDLDLPTAPGKWLTFTWVFVLSVVSCSLIGIFTASLAKSASSASAVANLPYVGLQFISGVYMNPITWLPAGMVTVASFFPIKWSAQGFRSVFLPDSMARYEMAGTWELGKTSLVLGAWCVAGLVLCLVTFRWSNTRR